MKNQMKTILLPLVTVSLLGVASASYADRGGCDYRAGGKPANGQKFAGKAGFDDGMKVERMARKLDLNENQQSQIQAIMDASKEDRQALRATMQNNREALKEAMGSDNTAIIRSLADQKGDLMAEKIVMRANTRSQIKAVLTPKQQEEFASIKRHGRKQR